MSPTEPADKSPKVPAAKKPRARSGYKIQLGRGKNHGGTASTSSEGRTKSGNGGKKTNPGPPPRPKTATQFGKADPVRDTLLFVLFLAVMFGISYLYQDVGRPSPEGKSSIGKLRQYRQKLAETLKSMDDRTPTRLDCDLFQGKSSIPSSGLGIFAGRNYTKGEEILSLGWPFVEIADGLWLPPLALVVKPHPTVVNVKPSATIWADRPLQASVTLSATRNIAAGEELLLDFASHPHAVLPELFAKVPTLQDYHEADEIAREARHVLKARSKQVSKKRKIEIGQGLRLTRKAVARYNPAVAAALPSQVDMLLKFEGEATSAHIMMKNQTVMSIGKGGSCISDLYEGKLTRSFKKGERLHSVLLYIRTKADAGACAGEECINPGAQNKAMCLSRPGSKLELCPLNGIEATAATEEQANAQYQWPANAKATSKPWKVMVDELSTENSLEVIAKQDLQAGEKVSIYLEIDSSSGNQMLPEDLYSIKWDAQPQDSV